MSETLRQRLIKLLKSSAYDFLCAGRATFSCEVFIVSGLEVETSEAMGVHNEFVRDIYEFVTYISDLVAETLEDCANEVFFPSGNQYFCVSEQASERECAPTAVKQVSLNVVVVVGNGNNHGETGDPFSYSTYIYVLVYRRNRCP